MHENHRFTSVEQINDAEIIPAIRYLDPDCRAGRTLQDTALGISLCMAIALIGALTYIGLYIRTL
jgi:hypothetical protein